VAWRSTGTVDHPGSAGEADAGRGRRGLPSYPGERFRCCVPPPHPCAPVDLEQKPFRDSRRGFWLARIFSTIRHLDGTLYVDRLEHFYAKIAAKVTRKRGWACPGSAGCPASTNSKLTPGDDRAARPPGDGSASARGHRGRDPRRGWPLWKRSDGKMAVTVNPTPGPPFPR